MITNHPTTITLSPANAETLSRFSDITGIDGNTLVAQLLTAAAGHVRAHGGLSFPLRLGLPSDHCALCPFGRSLPVPAPGAANILPGPGYSR